MVQWPEAMVAFHGQLLIRYRLHLFLCTLSQKAGQTDFHGLSVPPPASLSQGGDMACAVLNALGAWKLEFTFSSIPPVLFKETHPPISPVLTIRTKHISRQRGLQWEK